MDVGAWVPLDGRVKSIARQLNGRKLPLEPLHTRCFNGNCASDKRHLISIKIQIYDFPHTHTAPPLLTLYSLSAHRLRDTCVLHIIYNFVG